MDDPGYVASRFTPPPGEPSVEVVNAVVEALSNARENGHDFKDWTDAAIADDMFDCGGVAVDMPRDQVILAIRALRA